jgi:hypothetical protein
MDVLIQNEGYFANEQFEKKYNVLALVFLTEILRSELAQLPEMRLAVDLKLRLNARVLRDSKVIIEDTEYLLYLLWYCARHFQLDSPDSDMREAICRLAAEVNDRFLPGAGLRATPNSYRRFSFALALMFWTYEALVFPDGMEGVA